MIRGIPVICILLSAACATMYQPTPTSDEFRSSNSRRLLTDKKAPFDFNCEQKDMTFKELDSSVIGVIGCGKRATYKYIDGRGFLMESSSKNDGPPEVAE